jgi:hypothetical protein
VLRFQTYFPWVPCVLSNYAGGRGSSSRGRFLNGNGNRSVINAAPVELGSFGDLRADGSMIPASSLEECFEKNHQIKMARLAKNGWVRGKKPEMLLRIY